MTLLRAKEMTLEDAQRLLGFSPVWDGEFEDFLVLPDLDELERVELARLRSELLDYLTLGKMSEGQAQVIAILPLLRLAGYSRLPIQYRVEEGIARIYIEDEDTHIRGRFDIVAVNRSVIPSERIPSERSQALLWILVVESKNLEASEFAGIAQMLTYAYTSFDHQSAVWGLVTNGANYQFFYVKQSPEGHRTYHYMPSLSLIRQNRSQELLQVLKAIREWIPQE
jgi:hypothetical protein